MSLRFLVVATAAILLLNQAGLALLLISHVPPRPAFALSALLLLLFPTVHLVRARGIPLRDALRLRPAPPRTILLGAVTLLCILPALAAAAERWIDHPAPLEEFLTRMASADSPAGWAMVFLTLSIVPAVTEEIFFRGFLQRGLETHLGRAWGLILASVTFGLLHGLSRAPTSIVLGGMLGWMAMRTGSVLPGMVAHATVNALLVLAAARGDTGDVPGELTVPAATGVLSLAATALLLVSFARITRGSDPTPTTTGDAASPPRPRSDDPPAPE